MAGQCDEELRLDDLLRDPMITLVMRRDGVSPDEFRRLIRSKARRTGPPRALRQSGRQSIEHRPAA